MDLPVKLLGKGVMRSGGNHNHIRKLLELQDCLLHSGERQDLI